MKLHSTRKDGVMSPFIIGYSQNVYYLKKLALDDNNAARSKATKFAIGPIKS